MNSEMIVSVDAMGGDNAPGAVVDGCLLAVGRGAGFRIQLIGDAGAIRGILNARGYNGGRIDVVNATQTINGDEVPTRAIKEKKDSPIVVGLNMVKNNISGSFISCGNSGALLTGAMLITGRIKGVDRPALATVLPTKRGVSLLIDAGLNINCKPVNYEQFAQIGSIYMRMMYHIDAPKIGLLNVGTEETKGTAIVREAYGKLKALSDIRFIGNIEGRDLTDGKCDVVVCDGFVGNLVLKCYESIGSFVLGGVSEALKKNAVNRLAASVLKKDLKTFFKRLDPDEHSGAPILGVRGSVFKAHGNASSRTVMYAIERALDFTRSPALELIRNCFSTSARGGAEGAEWTN